MSGKRGRPPMGVVSIHVRVPPDVLAALDAVAAERGVTRADHIRDVLREWCLDNGCCP